MPNNNKLPYCLQDFSWVIKKLGFVLLYLSIIRFFCWIVNYSYFSDIAFGIIIKSFIYAIWVDVATLLLFNLWLILLIAFFPDFVRRCIKYLYLFFALINGGLVFLTIVDVVFFEYTLRRLSFDVLLLIPQSFTSSLILYYFKQHWYWLLLLIVLWRTATFRRYPVVTNNTLPSNKVKIARGVLIFLLCFIIIRGWQERPLSPNTALIFFPPKLTGLISNTGQNLLYSYYSKETGLKEKHYFTKEQLEIEFPIHHKMDSGLLGKKPNIVLFIMESFARDFLDSTSKFKAHTPFLDSIMAESLVFNNALSNGNESTYGLISIFTSLPPFMDVPYYRSSYHGVRMRGLGDMLNSMGYDCSFFLGDVDNSFGFKELTRSIGIKNYYGMKEFGNNKLYNGAWGIHDDYFFSYAADVLLSKKNPYFATIFNVSSHPPFIIPEERKGRFGITGKDEQMVSISYVDFAYRCFFEKLKKDSSFSNTVFLFIADHYYTPLQVKNVNTANINDIPFFIYKPVSSKLKGSRDYIVQQLDVLPTILELSGYVGDYMSFGSSVFNEISKGYSVQRRGNVFQIMDNSYVLGFDSVTDSVVYLYNYRTDASLKHNQMLNIIYNGEKTRLSNVLKAMIQQHNYGFNRNDFYYE